MNNFTLISPNLSETNSWSMNDIMEPKYMVTMSSLASAKKLELIRNEYKSKGKEPPSYTALILKAVSEVIKKYPEVNRTIIGPPFFRKIVKFEHFDINVAIEKSLPNLPGQAYTTPIRNIDQKNALNITEELKFLAQCNEENNEQYALFMKILKYIPWPFAKWLINFPYWSPKMWLKYRGGACWVNAPSKSGADLVFTVWPWPVTFSFGIVKERPVVINSQVMAETTIPLLMVFDRRLMGGGPAGRIFAEFKKIIEDADPKIFSDSMT